MTAPAGRGLIIAAPGSGSGKTTVTLGILRAMRRRGLAVRSAKSGPDYIDPRFHAAASGSDCVSLDAWAMSPTRIAALAAGPGLLLVEGAMGLFDGAPPDGKGATADLSRQLKLPVVLVVDVACQAQSVAAVVNGFATHDPMVNIVGLILNKLGSPRHEAMVRQALKPTGIPVLGAIFRQAGLSHPSRHLGLVQADEHADLQGFLDQVADVAERDIDLEVLADLAAPLAPAPASAPLPPPGQRIAIASDRAFAFAYPHLLNDWKAAGASLSFFSPLADEGPVDADAIILPGGYPELYAGTLAAADRFRESMIAAAQTTLIYGECGGYMVLGDGLIDADGKQHKMLELLRLETSFAKRKLHLGYRALQPFGGPWKTALNGHEFHYSIELHARGDALFSAQDAEGNALADMGLQMGSVMGSYAHVIDAGI